MKDKYSEENAIIDIATTLRKHMISFVGTLRRISLKTYSKLCCFLFDPAEWYSRNCRLSTSFFFTLYDLLLENHSFYLNSLSSEKAQFGYIYKTSYPLTIFSLDNISSNIGDMRCCSKCLVNVLHGSLHT